MTKHKRRFCIKRNWKEFDFIAQYFEEKVGRYYVPSLIRDHTILDNWSKDLNEFCCSDWYEQNIEC
jgi:hypothetical protein